MSDDIESDPEETKRALLGEIREHIKRYGHKEWRRVQEKFPTINDRYFWRMVAKVRDGQADEEILQNAVARAKVLARTKGMIPVAPSPAVIAAGGADITRSINFMLELQQILDDISMVREFSLNPADPETGKRSIKNPVFFTQSIKLRQGALELALRAYQEVWDLRKMSEFYDTIIEEIGKADPEVQRAIMEKLNTLNNERGLTMNAKVG